MPLRLCLAFLAILFTTLAFAGPVEDYDKLKKQGKAKEGLAALEKAADASPKDCKLLKALGSAYGDAKDDDLAVFTLERYLKECASDPDFAATKAKVEKHFESKATAALPPEDAGPGGLYIPRLPQPKASGGRTEDDAWAVGEDVDRVTKVMPDIEQAIELIRASKHAEAISRLESYTKRQPLDAQGFKWLGAAKAKSGDHAGALKAYEKYVSMDPKESDLEPIRKSVNFSKVK
jgi:Flp pilus assembly protein TadD